MIIITGFPLQKNKMKNLIGSLPHFPRFNNQLAMIEQSLRFTSSMSLSNVSVACN